jgi:hypothetical protein
LRNELARKINFCVLLFLIVISIYTAYIIWRSVSKGFQYCSNFITYATHATRLLISCGVSDSRWNMLLFIYIHFGTIAQSVDNYFVYVISDLISAFANSAEYLRYDESFDVVAIKTEERIHILRIIHNSIYPHAIYGLWIERFR